MMKVMHHGSTSTLRSNHRLSPTNGSTLINTGAMTPIEAHLAVETVLIISNWLFTNHTLTYRFGRASVLLNVSTP